MKRETILVVSDGDTSPLDDIFRGTGCNVIQSQIGSASRSAKRFIEEFGQDILVVVVCGLCLDDANAMAGYLKQECGCMHVIVLSDRVAEPVCERDKLYDVLIPDRRSDLRSMLETFLGFAEY